MNEQQRMPLLNPDIVWHELPSEVMLHDEGRKLIHVCNDSAKYIIEFCDGNTTVDEAVAALQKRYNNADAHELRLDVQQFAATLVKLGAASYD